MRVAIGRASSSLSRPTNTWTPPNSQIRLKNPGSFAHQTIPASSSASAIASACSGVNCPRWTVRTSGGTRSSPGISVAALVEHAEPFGFVVERDPNRPRQPIEGLDADASFLDAPRAGDLPIHEEGGNRVRGFRVEDTRTVPFRGDLRRSFVDEQGGVPGRQESDRGRRGGGGERGSVRVAARRGAGARG